MAITSYGQLIDIGAIKAACNQLREAAESYVGCSKKIQEAADTCDKNALSFDNISMQPSIESLATEVGKLKKEIEGMADSIESAAQSIYDAQKAELDAYLKSLEEKKET